MNKMRENFYVLGKNLDIAEDASNELLDDLFPDVTENFIEDYERVYNLSSDGDEIARRNRIISAMRQRGGLTMAYYESIGNKLGEGVYTVVITEGTGNIGFIVATYSRDTSPSGPATVIPAPVTPFVLGTTPYDITVTITGSSSEPDLEKTYERLKPPWTIFNYVYIP